MVSNMDQKKTFEFIELLYRRTEKNIVHDYIRCFSIDLEKQCGPDVFLKEAFQPENHGYRGFIDFREAYTYTPGEVVNGKVKFELNKESPIFKVELKIVGALHVLCESPVLKVLEWQDEVFFENKTTFFEYDSGHEPLVRHGEHSFDFTCQLPEDMIGCLEYEGEDGQRVYAIYSAEAFIYFSDHLEPIKTTHFVPVQRRFWINDPAIELHLTKKNRVQKQEKYMFGFGGTIDVQVTLKPGFFLTAGHDLLVDIHIDNKSRHDVDKVTCTLFQVARFHIRSVEVLKVQRRLASVQVPTKIDRKEQRNLHDVRLHTNPTLEPAISNYLFNKAGKQVILGYSVVTEVGVNSIMSHSICMQAPLLLCSSTQSDLDDWERARAAHKAKAAKCEAAKCEAAKCEATEKVVHYDFMPEGESTCGDLKTATDILIEPYLGALVLAEMKLKHTQKESNEKTKGKD